MLDILELGNWLEEIDTLVYVFALTGIKFFSQFSVIHLETNIWTMILAVAIADFLYYWEHRAEHRIRFFWAYHNVHHSSTDYNLTVASRLSWVETCLSNPQDLGVYSHFYCLRR